jgi:hypothetical protein
MKRRGFLGALGAIIGAPAAAAVATQIKDSQDKFKGLPDLPEVKLDRNTGQMYSDFSGDEAMSAGFSNFQPTNWQMVTAPASIDICNWQVVKK